MIKIAALILVAFGVLSCQSSEPDFKSSSVVFTDNLPQVKLAIVAAFEDGAYHGKRLIEFPYEYVIVNQQRFAVPRTNTWNLYGGPLPLTLISRGNELVPFDEGFEIKAESLGVNGSKVSITPTESATKERGYSISPHFTHVLSEKYHPPVSAETTNLFFRIEKQLREIRLGRTTPLAPTLDTKTNFYNLFWRSMDLKDKNDSDNWKKMILAWREIQTLETVAGSATNLNK